MFVCPHFKNFYPSLKFFKQEFVVGDGGNYGGFGNPPLPDDREVLFILGVVSTYDGVSKYVFSEPSNPIGVDPPDTEHKSAEGIAESQPPSQSAPVVVVEEDPGAGGNSFTKLLEETDLIEKIPVRKTKPITGGRSVTRRQRLPYGRDPPALVVGLSAAIGVLGFLLLISIVVYFYLRLKVHRNDANRRNRSRKRSDRQALTHGGSTSTIEMVCFCFDFVFLFVLGFFGGVFLFYFFLFYFLFFLQKSR